MNITYILEIGSYLSLVKGLDLIPTTDGEAFGSFFVFPDFLKAKKWIHNLGSVNQEYLPHSLNFC